MYNLIFYYIYCQQINKGKSIGFARFNGGLIVFLTIWLHAFLILAIIEKYFKHKVDIAFFTNNKTLEYSFMLLCIWFAFLYFNNKRVEKIDAEFSEKGWFNNYGGFLTLLLIFAPLISIVVILS